MPKKVLIATDGSDHANRAVAFGSDIASKYDAEVLLVHVLMHNELSDDLRRMAEVEGLTAEGGQPLAKAMAEVPAGRFPASMSFSSDSAMTPDRVLRAVGNQILAKAENVAHKHGVGVGKVSKRIEDGKPVDRILELVESENVDLVVSGARGLSDIGALMLGSVSHKLSHASPVPCVTVR